jgi:MoxR-like ATPase
VALLKASRAMAALEGRAFVIPDDVHLLAPAVLAHRITPRPESLMEDVDGRAIVRQILETTPVPRAVA